MKIKQRKKRCKWCNALFQPIYSTLQKACSPTCAMSLVEQTKKDAKKELDKAEKEHKEQKSLGADLAKTQKIVNEYVRLRDKHKPCASSNIPWQPDFDAGHVFSVKQYSALRFDLDNIHGQSINSNRFNEGDEQNYLLNLPNRIGKERTEALIKRAELSKRYVKKWTRHELKMIREEVKLLTKQLKTN